MLHMRAWDVRSEIWLVLLLLAPVAAMLFMTAGSALAQVKDADLDLQVEGNTALACDLYGRLRAEAGDANLFFSPYSLSTALAMTYAGARSDTGEQMARALHFRLDQARLHPAFAALAARLEAVQKAGKVRLDIANSLWPQQGFPFLPEFLDLARKNYGVSITPVDYINATETARLTINRWIEDKTERKITDLLPPRSLDALSRLVLANAIYFKGAWACPFKPAETVNQPFYLLSGGEVQAALMHQQVKDRCWYGENDDLQVLDMPYAGNDLSMLVLLPKRRDGLAQAEAALTPENLQKWIRALGPRQVNLWFPKFTMTSSFSLPKTLEALGMTDAFDREKADFSGLNGRRNLYITAVLHKAFIEVNEAGTEAAAASAVVIGLKSMARPQPPVEFRADHPFLFLIREKSTGSPLFLGRVTSPR